MNKASRQKQIIEYSWKMSFLKQEDELSREEKLRHNFVRSTEIQHC